MIRYLNEAVAEGVLDPQPVEPLAHLLAALGAGSAMYVAHADDPVGARRQISEYNERFLSALGVREDAGDGPRQPPSRPKRERPAHSMTAQTTTRKGN
jgi:hypothetical protein